MRDIKFDFIYKGDHQFHHKKYYLSELINKPLSALSDVHGFMELVAIRQYTEIKDRDGDELYEKDVVHIEGYGDYICEFPFIELYESHPEGDIGKKKGNIYENPELLE